jgi:methionyl-tRNA formyltransferase
MRIVLAGRYNIAVRCLEHLLKIGHEVVAVVEPSGDPKDGWQRSLSNAACENGVAAFRGRIDNVIAELETKAPDIIVSLQYPYLFRSRTLALPRRGCINLHFSKLPKYGGCYPIAWALLKGESITGVTLHEMEETFDTGDVVGQVAIEISDSDTARVLYEKATDAAFDLFCVTMRSLEDGAVRTTPQNLEEATYYTRESIDFARDRFVDWRKSARELHNRIRAFNFPPFQYAGASIGGGMIELLDSTILEDLGFWGPAGTILEVRKNCLAIATGRGVVGVARFQRSNGTDASSPYEFSAIGLLKVGTRFDGR